MNTETQTSYLIEVTDAGGEVRSYEIAEELCRLGASVDDADIVIEDPSLGAVHLELTFDGCRVYVRGLAAEMQLANVAMPSGARFTLPVGAALCIGFSTLVLRQVSAAAEPEAMDATPARGINVADMALPPETAPELSSAESQAVPATEPGPSVEPAPEPEPATQTELENEPAPEPAAPAPAASVVEPTPTPDPAEPEPEPAAVPPQPVARGAAVAAPGPQLTPPEPEATPAPSRPPPFVLRLPQEEVPAPAALAALPAAPPRAEKPAEPPASPEDVRVSTGGVPWAYELERVVFAICSADLSAASPGDAIECAFRDAEAALRVQAHALGGHAVAFARFEQRVSASTGLLAVGRPALEVFAYGTVVRRLV